MSRPDEDPAVAHRVEQPMGQVGSPHLGEQAEILRLTGEPTSRDDLRAIAAAWHDAVRRLPVVALGDVQHVDGIAHQLRAIAETTPVADTAGPWTSIKAHYAMRQQEQRSTAP